MSAPGLVRTEETPTPANLRLRQAHAASDLLPSLGLNVAPTTAGRLAVEMPAHLAELFLADLEQRAGEWKEAMRKARVEELKRAAELQAATGEARRQWEATADGWTRTYLALRDAGKGHREALRWIRGPKPRLEQPQIGTIELGVQEGLARIRAKVRDDRAAAVCRLAKAGKTRQEIADALRLDYQRVTLILQKAGIAPVKGDRGSWARTTTLGTR
jgi:hypothetical protein